MGLLGCRRPDFLRKPGKPHKHCILAVFPLQFFQKGAEKGRNNYKPLIASLSVALVQECSKLVKPVPLIALE